MGRREFAARTGPGGRASVKVKFSFEAEYCPVCGAELLKECGRCRAPILIPVSDRCDTCGLPQPWAPQRAERRVTRARSWEPNRVRRGQLPADQVFSAGDAGALWMIEGDITEFEVAAVVSDDDVEARMWTQVASAIKRAAGEDVERTPVGENPPFALGHAWTTGSGELEAVDRIIHVALMDSKGQTTLDHLAACVRNALEEADRRGLHSVAIATIGTAPYAIKPNKWLAKVAEVTVAYLKERRKPKSLAVLVVLYEPKDFSRELRRFRRAAARANDRTFKARKTTALAAPPAALLAGAAAGLIESSLLVAAVVTAALLGVVEVVIAIWTLLVRPRRVIPRVVASSAADATEAEQQERTAA